MINFLFIIPVLALLSAVLVYRHNGKRDFLRLDAVQFIYAFVIAPLFFVWLKGFFFFVIRQELDVSLSLGEVFFFDTALSLVALYIFAFVVMHSLTKTFELKRKTDPLYDMFEHSEFFHWDFTHLGLNVGALALFSIISLVNVLIPVDWQMGKTAFYSLLNLGFLAGIVGFVGIWNYESPEPNFMRLMKLIYAIFFIIHLFFYYFFDPDFSSQYGLFWFFFFALISMIAMSLFAERRENQKGLLGKLPFKINLYKPRFYLKYFVKKFNKFIE